jgi:predicted transposase
MKQTLIVKLALEPEQRVALLRTLETFSAACNDVAGTAFEAKCANKIDLQKLLYYDIRQRFGLSAQMCIRAISKVVEAYKRDREKRPAFRAHGAMTYDERILNFTRPNLVSLLTLDGRIVVPFRFGAYQKTRLDRIQGQADLLYRNGTFYLACTVDAPEPAPDEAREFFGVDLGVVNIAVTSDGEIVNQGQGCLYAHVNTVRGRYARLRAKLQK